MNFNNEAFFNDLLMLENHIKVLKYKIETFPANSRSKMSFEELLKKCELRREFMLNIKLAIISGNLSSLLDINSTDYSDSSVSSTPIARYIRIGHLNLPFEDSSDSSYASYSSDYE